MCVVFCYFTGKTGPRALPDDLERLTPRLSRQAGCPSIKRGELGRRVEKPHPRTIKKRHGARTEYWNLEGGLRAAFQVLGR